VVVDDNADEEDENEENEDAFSADMAKSCATKARNTPHKRLVSARPIEEEEFWLPSLLTLAFVEFFGPLALHCSILPSWFSFSGEGEKEG